VSKSFEYAVPTTATYSEYEVALAAALIERMHRFCVERGIRFIVVDIPVPATNYSYKSSLPQTLIERLAVSRIEYLSSMSFLEGYDGSAEIHVPHGHRHISEFTHTLWGRSWATADCARNQRGKKVIQPRRILVMRDTCAGQDRGHAQLQRSDRPHRLMVWMFGHRSATGIATCGKLA